MTEPLRTRFAPSGDARIAYQVMGSGPVDLILLPDGHTPMEATLEEPSYARFVRRLASFSRLIRFDRRGTGLSDPLRGSDAPTLAMWADDAVAVMDAAGSDHAGMLGLAEGGLVAATAAATRPERVSKLILVNSTPGEAVPLEDPGDVLALHIQLEQHIDETWEGDDEQMDHAISAFAPSAVGDPRYRSWLDRATRHAMSPTTAHAFFKVLYRADIRDVLPSINRPTLIIHRAGNTYMRPVHAQYLADHIAGARYVEVPGADHVVYLGDIEPILDEIERFLLGKRSQARQEREIATVLFTDIVGSTEFASQLGDRRWRELLDEHDLVVRRLLRRFGGREVKSTGDGTLAVFEEQFAAIRCACAIGDELRGLGIDVRAGLHHGEIERRGDDIAGITVNIAARIEALAAPGEVLASAALRQCEGILFADRGRHQLKGVPATWQLFAVLKQE